MAAAAAVSAALSTLHHFSLSNLTRTRCHFRTLNLSFSISASSSSSSTSPRTEFNITFAPDKPKPNPSTLTNETSDENDLRGQMFIPWITRDENGNLSMQTSPPAHLLHALAHAKTQSTKKKKKPETSKKQAASIEPKHSKAARRFYNENFRDPPQRLSKVLAAAGVASRRSSEELVFEGKVTVNGSVCNTPQTKVDPARDMIYVNGNRLPKKLPPKVYLALNKPKGYICSAGEKETKSALSLFDDYLKTWDKRNPGQPKPRLFTVGRLDVATSGLIIVTNDGEFAQNISHPSANLSKEYIATIEGTVNKRHLVTISEGTMIDGVQCTPDAVELLPQQPELKRPRIRVVVHEGRNHEVRELVKNAGLEIYSLKRIRIGGFRLPADLSLGKYIELKQSNLNALGWKRDK
ncbi:putative ribosomal large subunit pseudouridine synthase SVR1, chloroplastic [Impatiens glandulifera]|uniref:putative ribosomal large subunit pseudouridine synthase SVR1, chloroplastic n=1 Tax=Impatiens glandulifera TaxID=253017 RepID=UPI001FB05C24|nr:putative ribosomal large subunit pseudouridine synthase SVR1, chloroplastic [Impatiens glandulifera]